MSKAFYIILPSDTLDPATNRANKFTVRLPQTLRFNSTWHCGLVTISYPLSHATLGTTSEQAIYIQSKDERYTWPHSLVRVPVESKSYTTPQQLDATLNRAIQTTKSSLEG